MRVSSLVFSGVFLALLLRMFFYGEPKQSIVFFNQEALQGQFIRQLAEHQASTSQVARATQQFHQSMKKVLAGYIKDHHAIILNEKCVMAGSNDITEEVSLKLSRLMRKKA